MDLEVDVFDIADAADEFQSALWSSDRLRIDEPAEVLNEWWADLLGDDFLLMNKLISCCLSNSARFDWPNTLIKR